MSIASAITAAQGRVENAYTAVSTKGGTLPATQDLTNLPDAIISIPSGGSGGDSVEVCAYGSAEGYTGDEKVLLNPPSSVEVIPANLTNPLTTYAAMIGKVTIANSEYISVRQNPAVNRVMFKRGSTGYTYKGVIRSVTDSTGYTIGTEGGLAILDKDSMVTMYENTSYHNVMIGFTNDTYTLIYNTLGRTSYFHPYQYVYFKGYVGAAGEAIFYYTDAALKSASVININYYHLFFYEDGGVNYEVRSNGRRYTINGLATPVDAGSVTLPTTSFTSGDAKIVPLTKDASYVLAKLSTGTVQLWQKSDSGWTNINTFADVYTDIYANTSGYICLFNSSTKAQYYGKVDMVNGTLERLQNIFLDHELPATINQYCFNLVDNIALVYGESPELITVKNLDTAIPYQFVAIPPTASEYNSSSLTGFVSENLGRDSLDHMILKVNTVLDPNAQPWSDIDVVFGMNISVDPREELSQSYTGTLDNLNMSGIVMSLNMSGAQSTLTDSKYIMKSIVFSKPSTIYSEGSDVYLNVFEMKSGESTYSYVSSSTNATHTTLDKDGVWTFTGIEVNVNSKYLLTATTSPSPLLSGFTSFRARVYSVPSGGSVGSFAATSCTNPPALSFAWIPAISIGLEKIEEGSIHISKGYYNSGTYQINMPSQQVSFSAMSSGQNLSGKNSPFACSYNDTASVALTYDNAPTGTFDVYAELDHPLYVNSEGTYLLGDSVVSSIGVQALTTYGGFKTTNTGVLYNEEQGAAFWYPSVFTKTLEQLKTQENLSDVNNLFYVNISGKDESDIVASYYDSLEGHLIPGQVVFAQNSPGDDTVELPKGYYKITVVGGGGGSAAHGSGGSGTYTSGSLTAVNNGQTVWGGEGH